MLTMQHYMLGVLHGDHSDSYMQGMMMPDVIRGYGVSRKMTHSEESIDGKDVAWWQFPTDVKNMTREDVAAIAADGHDIHDRSMPFGELSHPEVFAKHNQSLPDDEYKGIMSHLAAQDCAFDDFVRDELIDVTHMHEAKDGECRVGARMDKALVPERLKKMVDGATMHDKDAYATRPVDDGMYYFDTDKAARGYVTDAEQHGIYVLAERLWKEKGITANQEWFDKIVGPKMHEFFPDDLADSAMKYMKLDSDYDELITNHDFSYATAGPAVDKKAYDKLYDRVLSCMDAIDASGKTFDYQKWLDDEQSKVSQQQRERSLPSSFTDVAERAEQMSREDEGMTF